MRLSTRLIVTAVLLAPAILFPACGSSPNGSSPGSDAGAADGSIQTLQDSGGQSPDSTVSSGDAGGGSDTGATPVDSGTPSEDASNILGANCPAVDAAGFVEGPHGPLPTVAYSGGGILEAPQIITFTFSTTPAIPTLQAYGQTITRSPWFAEVTKDYCVNDGGTCITPGELGLSVEMDASAASLYVDTFGQGTAPTGVDLDSFINDQIASAVAANVIPAPGPNSLYAFYFPPSSTISFGPPQSGGQNESCVAFGGYHYDMTYKDGHTPIVYAIMPDCPTGDPALDLQSVTVAASHEIIEATTDPYPYSGWYLDQDMDLEAGAPTVPQYRNEPWANADSFGEMGDNCESLVLFQWTLDSGIDVQRIWSPSAAALGHNPCIPVPEGESYYNASPDKVLYVADVGSSFMVDVSAFSDVPRSSWRVDALDGTPTQLTGAGGGPLQYLSFEFVGGTDAGDGIAHLLCVNNKTTGQVKVTLLADPAADTSLTQAETWPEADAILYSVDVNDTVNFPEPDGGVYSTLAYQEWPFAVITPAIAETLGVSDAGIVDAVKLAELRGKYRGPRVRGQKHAPVKFSR
ncbi:MAG: hypothetical protein ACLQVI_41120 [Polyangiaceae bacterium]